MVCSDSLEVTDMMSPVVKPAKVDPKQVRSSLRASERAWMILLRAAVRSSRMPMSYLPIY